VCVAKHATTAGHYTNESVGKTFFFLLAMVFRLRFNLTVNSYSLTAFIGYRLKSFSQQPIPPFNMLLARAIYRKGLSANAKVWKDSFKTLNQGLGLSICRYYSPMTEEEKKAETKRVKNLTAEQKNYELRDIDRQLSLLYMKRDINTGDILTYRGRFKALMREYGFYMVAWYGTVWFTMGVMIYTAIEVGGVDVIALAARFDSLSGSNIENHLNPSVGAVGLTLVINECLEVIRTPFVVMTTKPMVDKFFPQRYLMDSKK
jgi:Protein of unknown function (DUF1279)